MKVPPSRLFLSAFASVIATLVFISSASAQLTLTGSLVLAEQGGTFGTGGNPNLGTLGSAFANGDLGDTLGLGFHQDFNLNDGIYGNGNSWIGDPAQPPAPGAPSFGGIAFNAPLPMESFAFGRDNPGTFTDRTLGLYTLQFTADTITTAGVADPALVAGATWTDIGTLNYGAAGTGNYSNPSMRHRYNFAEVTATGIRLITPGGAAVDELEVYSDPGAIVAPPPPPPPFVITSAPGYDITWDGNDGDNFDPNLPAVVPDNLALASNGSAASTTSDLGPQLSIPFHVAANLNDGSYGNSNSWISGDADAGGDPTATITLPGQFLVDGFAFGRDNGQLNPPVGTEACAGGQCTDRSLGLYDVEITADGANWVSVGTIEYTSNGTDDGPGGEFTAYLRHQFGLLDDQGNPVLASGLRIHVPVGGLGGGTALDEIEIYGSLVPEPSTPALLGLALAGLLLRRRR